jgi:exosome complex RNA-binding protein Csl4
MAKTTRTKQLRELRNNARATVLLVRTFVPKLVRGLLEQLAIEDWVRARLSPRRRRTSRPLVIGASAVGVVAAGAAAARLAGYRGPFGDDGSEADRT